jgi:hypothetical protein
MINKRQGIFHQLPGDPLDRQLPGDPLDRLLGLPSTDSKLGTVSENKRQGIFHVNKQETHKQKKRAPSISGYFLPSFFKSWSLVI